MADTRGVWGLSEAWAEKAAAEWVPFPNVFTKNVDFGHGSFLPGIFVRYNTQNSTVHNTSIQGSTNACASGGNQTQTYQSGGNNNSSDIRKLTYSTYTFNSNLPINVLTDKRDLMGTVCKETDVYYTGAEFTPAGSPLSTTQKLTFSNDSIALVPGCPYASGSQAEQASFTGGGLYGYFWSGVSNPVNSKVHKLTFSNDTMAIIPASEPTRYRLGWNIGDTTKGYVVGGTLWVSSVTKLTYSDETFAAAPSSNLPLARGTGVCFTAGADTGLYSAGRNNDSPYYYSNTYLLTFSTESWDGAPAMDNTLVDYNTSESTYDYGTGKGTSARDSRIGSVSSYTEDGNRRWFDNAQETTNTGYSVGGRVSVPSATTSMAQKIDFSTDTSSTEPYANFNPARRLCFGAGSNTTGYVMGGTDGSPSSGERTAIKINYATGTATEATNPDSHSQSSFMPGPARFSGISMSNGNTTLYFQGGHGGSVRSNWHKLAYSEDTWETLPSGSLYRRNGAAAASATAGYAIMGNFDGQPSGGQFQSRVSKLVFATDTRTNPTSADMPQEAMENRGLSESTAAYSMGGKKTSSADMTIIQKLTFATDTSSALPETLSSVRYNMQSFGNQTQGYVAGGNHYGPSNTEYHSYVDKFVYATSTISAISNLAGGDQAQGAGVSPRSDNLPAIEPLPATPTASTTLTGPQGIKAEGYLIQGIQGSTSGSGRSDVYRLNYNTDTWDSSVFANSTLTRKRGGAASTTTNAYIGGGNINDVSGNPTGGDMDKLTYATSTMSRIPGSDAGGIPGKSTDAAAAGNQTQGYWTFGTGDQSGCDKLVYSTETAAALPNLPWNAKNTVAVSMQTAGYYGSGDGFDDENTSFTRITFSNDTYATYSGWFYTPGGFAARYRCGSSSSTKAYIVGGQNAPRCMDVTPWSTNSTSNSPTTFLASPGFYKAPGQGSNEAGYFTGGGNTGNNGTTTEKITYASDTTAIVPSAYFSSSSPSGVNSYTTGGPNMNGLGTNVPNVI